MMRVTDTRAGVLAIEAGGLLKKEDYEALVPRLEQELERGGKLRVLIRVHDFRGWTPPALVEELRFDLRHRKDFERIAVVGERTLEKLVTNLCKPFFGGAVRYFEDEAQARAWMGEARSEARS